MPRNRSPTSRTPLTRRVISFSIARTRRAPSPASSRDLAISDRISPAEAAARCANWRTSPATTANPLPWSPARAASTAAFSASRFV
jgi:hypothetical protein